MSLDLGTLVAYLDIDDSGLDKGLNRAEGKMSSTGGRLGSLAKGAGLAIAAGLGVAVTAAGGAAIALYGTGVEVDALGKKAATVFGPELGKAQQWAAENAAAMGLTRSQAVGLAAGFGDLLIPMGFTREQATKMSTDVIGLSGALSEWSGGQKSAAEVADILSAAMLGETDGLKSLGISLSAAEITAGLAAKGQDKLTGAALQQATAIEIQRQILAKSTDAQKAYADGADDPIRKQALLRARALEVKEAFATALLPASNAVIGVFLELSDGAMPKLDSALSRGSEVVQNLAKQIPNLVGAFQDGDLYGAAEVLDNIFGNTGKKIAGFERGLTTARDVMRDVGAVLLDVLLPALTGSADGIGALLSPLGLAKEALGFVADNAETFEAVLSVLIPVLGAMKLAQVAIAVSTGGWAAAQAVLNAVMAANPIGIVIVVLAGLAAALVYAYKHSETFRDIVKGVFGVVQRAVGDAVGFIIQGFRGLLTVWLTVAGGIVSGAATALGWIPGLGGKLKKAEAAFATMKRGILGTLDDLADKAHSTGANAGQGLANGLRSKELAVARAAQTLALTAGRAMATGLQERSPSRVTHRIGAYAGEGLVLGMLGKVGDVTGAASALATAATPALSAPGIRLGAGGVRGGDGAALRLHPDDLAALSTAMLKARPLVGEMHARGAAGEDLGETLTRRMRNLAWEVST